MLKLKKGNNSRIESLIKPVIERCSIQIENCLDTEDFWGEFCPENLKINMYISPKHIWYMQVLLHEIGHYIDFQTTEWEGDNTATIETVAIFAEKAISLSLGINPIEENKEYLEFTREFIKNPSDEVWHRIYNICDTFGVELTQELYNRVVIHIAHN